MHELIEEMIRAYGYYALFVGTLLEGETIMLLSGIAARQEFLELQWVIPIGFIGSLTGDQTIFFLSRLWLKRYINRWPSWQPRIARINALLEKHGTWFMFSFRFFYGIRNLTPVVIGASSVRTSRFVFLNVMGAMVWATVVGGLGYLLGELFLRLLGRLHTVILILLGLAVLAWLLRHVYLHYRIRRALCALPPESRPPEPPAKN